MIYLSDSYSNRLILSLRTGGPIGLALSPIINSSNLKIDGWYATMQGSNDVMVLPAMEVRDTIPKGLVVNDHDSITPLEDMVRMKNVIDAEYELIGKVVVTENGNKLGKVQEYAVDNKSLYIKKLYTTQSIFKSISSFTKPQLIIDRSQIVDITKDKIVVKEASEKASSTSAAAARA